MREYNAFLTTEDTKGTKRGRGAACGRWRKQCEGGSTSSSVMEGLLTMLLSDRFGALQNDSTQSKRSPEADALREKVKKDMEKKK